MSITDPLVTPALVLGTRCGRCRCRDKKPGCSCTCHQYWCDCHGERRPDCLATRAAVAAAAAASA